MQPLDPAVAAAMRAEAQAIRERQSQGNFTRSWSLAGKNAIVEQGKAVIVRLMPRWDIGSSVMKGPDGKTVPNPAYKKQRAYANAIEHWWDSEGKTQCEYCPRSVDENAYCVVCAASQALISSSAKEDRDLGKRIKPTDVYIYNAVVGTPRRLSEDKLVDIRILKCSRVQHLQIVDIMSPPPDQAQFGRGDIMNAREGYDLLFKRPVSSGGGGERWQVTVAPNATPLYDSATEAAAFKGWLTRLTNLEEMLDKEVKDSAGIFKAYYGRDPEPSEIGLTSNPVPAQQPQAPVQEQQESSEEPQGPDDEFMGLQPPAASAPQTAQKPAPPQAPSVPTGVRAPRAPRR